MAVLVSDIPPNTIVHRITINHPDPDEVIFKLIEHMKRNPPPALHTSPGVCAADFQPKKAR